MSFDKVRNTHKENKDKPGENTTPTMYLNFSFYKVDSKWRWLNDIGKEEAAKEFSSLIEVANTKMKVRTYSTLGLRKESDFMIWGISAYSPSDEFPDDSVEEIIYYKGSLAFFQEWIHEITGITPPDVLAEAIRTHGKPMQIWMDWWDANKDRMTDAQKAEIWRTLAKDPWEIVEVESA